MGSAWGVTVLPAEPVCAVIAVLLYERAGRCFGLRAHAPGIHEGDGDGDGITGRARSARCVHVLCQAKPRIRIWNNPICRNHAHSASRDLPNPPLEASRIKGKRVAS